MTESRNAAAIFLPSASRTTTQTSGDIQVDDSETFVVFVDTTVFGTGSVTVTINTKDPASGKYINLLTSVAIVATGTVVLVVSPYIPAAANTNAQKPLGATIQIVATANNANAQTYSVGYALQ